MRAVAAVVLALTLSACPGDPAPTESDPGSAPAADSAVDTGADTGRTPLDCDIGRLLRGCSASICHQQSRREGDLSLDVTDPLGPQIAAELIGVPAAYNVA